jgi:hypothetical protein
VNLLQAFLKLTCFMRLFRVLTAWQPLQRIHQILWSRDCPKKLQKRSKRASIQPNLHPGTVVRGQGQKPPIPEQEKSRGAGEIYLDVMIWCELQLQEVTDVPFTSY